MKSNFCIYFARQTESHVFPWNLARLARFHKNLKPNLARFWLVWLEPKLVSARLAILKLEKSSSRLVSPILGAISRLVWRAKIRDQIFWKNWLVWLVFSPLKAKKYRICTWNQLTAVARAAIFSQWEIFREINFTYYDLSRDSRCAFFSQIKSNIEEIKTLREMAQFSIDKWVFSREINFFYIDLTKYHVFPCNQLGTVWQVFWKSFLCEFTFWYINFASWR